MTDNDSCGATPYDQQPVDGSPAQPASIMVAPSRMCGKCLGFWTVVLIAVFAALLFGGPGPAGLRGHLLG